LIEPSPHRRPTKRPGAEERRAVARKKEHQLSNEQSSDPFDDLTAHRVTSWDDTEVEKVLLTVPVRRPGRREFFRVHPDAKYVLDTVIFEREDGFDTETYMVAPELHPMLATELKLVRLHLCVERRGSAFLWPLKLPGGSDAGRSWRESALQVAEVAKAHWVRMVGNKAIGAYDLYKAGDDLGAPEWPDKAFNELCRLAFGKRYITSIDHDALKELRGEV
jgi:hypothetical protein